MPNVISVTYSGGFFHHNRKAIVEEVSYNTPCDNVIDNDHKLMIIHEIMFALLANLRSLFRLYRSQNQASCLARQQFLASYDLNKCYNHNTNG